VWSQGYNRVVHVLDGTRIPIYSWAPHLEPGAVEQARDCTELSPAFHHVAVMADGHRGYGVPIGAVLALDDAVSPYAVGNDIGCGMALVPTTITIDDLLAPVRTRSGGAGPDARDDIMGWIQSTVPAGTDVHPRPRSSQPVDALLHMAYDALHDASVAVGVPLSTSPSPQLDRGQPLTRDEFLYRGGLQIGTLGAGNHFLELLGDPDGLVWVMVHSGSRGIGGLVCANFHRMALAACADQDVILPDPGLAWLPLGSGDRWARAGECYDHALHAVLAYAQVNRQRMLEDAAGIIERRFPEALRWDQQLDIHHNDATVEAHFGRVVRVHRKGAVKASAGTPTIIPGSMGTGTYLGRGLGNPDAFASSSHGAGRIMSRAQARRQLTLDAQLARVEARGGKVFAANKAAVLDEMPDAYKDLDEVMNAQRDLVEPIMHLHPLATYKGSERARRTRGWRAGEQR
jgi:tRNA-splicing ligase RtcB